MKKRTLLTASTAAALLAAASSARPAPPPTNPPRPASPAATGPAQLRHDQPPHRHIPQRRRARTFRAGQRVSLEDITSDYTYLYRTYEGLEGTKPPAEVTNTDQFRDFKAKFYFLFEAIIDTHGKHIAYPWEISFVDNMTREKFRKLALDSIRHQMQTGIAEHKLTSPSRLSGRTGRVAIEYTDGMRTVPEIANLMHTLPGQRNRRLRRLRRLRTSRGSDRLQQGVRPQPPRRQGLRPAGRENQRSSTRRSPAITKAATPSSSPATADPTWKTSPPCAV
jgi:hypothetical protein